MDTILKRDFPRTIWTKFGFIPSNGSELWRKRFSKTRIFQPITSHDSQFGCWASSSYKILEEDHPRSITSKFDPMTQWFLRRKPNIEKMMDDRHQKMCKSPLDLWLLYAKNINFKYWSMEVMTSTDITFVILLLFGYTITWMIRKLSNRHWRQTFTHKEPDYVLPIQNRHYHWLRLKWDNPIQIWIKF